MTKLSTRLSAQQIGRIQITLFLGFTNGLVTKINNIPTAVINVYL